jgi:nitrogen-specific signal transduction histidine kinase
MKGDGLRRAAAEGDGLRELLAMLTHDLSNPLQSLTVLCELAMAEAETDAEQERASQCLEATRRMNAIVLAISKVVRRDGPGDVRGVLDRLLVLFARRIDRHDVDIVVETSAIDDVIPSLAIEQAILNLLLAAIARFTEERSRCGFSLSLRGSRPSPSSHPTRCELVLALDVVEGDGSRRRLALSPEHCARIEDLIADEPTVTFERTEDTARLSFDGSGR